MTLKHVRSICLTFFVALFLAPGISFGEEHIKIFMNGKLQNNFISYFNPIKIDSHVLVPLRGISEAFGAKLDWNNQTEKITIVKDDNYIRFTIDSSDVIVNGLNKKMEVPVRVVNGQSYAPLRIFGEAFHASIEWNARQNAAFITYSDNPIQNQPKRLENKTNLNSHDDSITDIVRLNDKKVVFIKTNKGLGSGVIVGNGLILTNIHLIKEATEAKVVLTSGKSFSVAGIVDQLSDHDIALIKTAEKFGIGSVKFGTTKALEKGQRIITIGSPIGLQNSVSDGIISGFRRLKDKTNVIQTTATIYYGSSGGGMFNLNGELVGITTGTFNDKVNLNYAISIDQLKPWLKKYQNQLFEELNTRPLPGVEKKQIHQQLAEKFGEIATTKGSFSLNYNPVGILNETYVITALIDSKDYKTYTSQYSVVKPDVSKWIDQIIEELTTILPRKKVLFTIYYWDSFENMPKEFPENELHYKSGKWFVKHKIIQVIKTDKLKVEIRK